MRINTRVVSDIATGKVLERESFDYSGPLELANSAGRPQADAASAGAIRAAQTGGNEFGAWWNPFQKNAKTVENFGTSLIPQKSGVLSPYAQAAYEQQKRNIQRNAADAVGTGVRTMAERGMGTGPSGGLASIINTGARQEGEAETNAYADAMKQTPAEGMVGAGLLGEEQQLANPLAANAQQAGAFGTAAEAAAARNRMGSVLGDIGTGIGMLSGTFSNIGTGGQSMGLFR